MQQVRTDRIVQLPVGCALFAGAVLALRLRLFRVRVGRTGLSPSSAVQDCRQRIHATQILLRTDRLEMSCR